MKGGGTRGPATTSGEEGAKGTREGVDDNITKARKTLSAMARRALQNKILMFGIAAFLLVGIIIIIYVKVK